MFPPQTFFQVVLLYINIALQTIYAISKQAYTVAYLFLFLVTQMQ